MAQRGGNANAAAGGGGGNNAAGGGQGGGGMNEHVEFTVKVRADDFVRLGNSSVCLMKSKIWLLVVRGELR